jgi:excinuclease ABC subunit A
LATTKAGNLSAARGSAARRRSAKELDTIQIKGAREHNLQNIDIELPKKKLIVFTGVSGSGKSSLAFDTLFAEGQRRYVESLSAYARQFIGQMEKPHYDMIRGLSPTIAIDQKAASRNPRSTVGTITEVYDYLRVLFARIGQQHCMHCGKPVGHGDAQSMVQQILELPDKSRLLLLAPVVENRKGEHRKQIQALQRQGYARLRVDGVVQAIENVQKLARHKKHTIEAVVDRVVVKPGKAFKARLTDSVELALKLGRGNLIVHVVGGEEIRMSEARSCCDTAYPELDPTLFSFNSPQGMCPRCNGIGTRLTMDVEKLVPDGSLSIREGAVAPLRSAVAKGNGANGTWGGRQLAAAGKAFGIDFDKPWRKLPKAKRDILLYGAPDREFTVQWESEKIHGQIRMRWEGVVNTMMRRYRQTTSDGQKKYYSSFMSSKPCRVCGGRRLRPEALHVRIAGQSIIDVTAMTIGEAHGFLHSLVLTGSHKLIAEELLKEIGNRLRFLLNVGLDYLSLDRPGPTLSGGEAQRIRLASQVGSELTGVLYILDEPSIGLHQRDNIRLLETLCHLRDIGNTLIVIEHDRETMEAADWLVDIGPGAGLLGGRIVAQGTPSQIRRSAIFSPGCPSPTCAGTKRGATRSTSRGAGAKPATETATSRWKCTFWPTFTCPAKPAGASASTTPPWRSDTRTTPSPMYWTCRCVQARDLFRNHPRIRRILDTLMDVGLSYIKLGQAATTLSGGEAQRIKLARELAKRATGAPSTSWTSPPPACISRISRCCWPCSSGWWTAATPSWSSSTTWM